jgi:NADH-quinone oxidoreductase subunit C
MSEQLQSAINALRDRFAAQPCETCKEGSLMVPIKNLLDACQALRDEFGFEMLVEETAVDYWPQLAPRFHIVYRLRSLQHNLIIGLRVALDGNDPIIPTIEKIYPNANWLERELWDMFGIRFEKHSDMRRILMPYDWEGHPLRKDFPSGYEEVQYSFNFDEIDIRKPYAQE